MKRKPKQSKTDLVIILDRSGSMESIKSDMEGGFNAFIREQRKLPDPCAVTLVQFDSESTDTVYTDTPLAKVPALDLHPRGGTPLLDAVGSTLSTTEARVKKGARVMVVILTDGLENASREWTKAKVQTIVKRLTKAGWGFLYLGANVDAFAEAAALGVPMAAAANYTPSAAGVQSAFAAASASSVSYRTGGSADLTDEDRKKLI